MGLLIQNKNSIVWIQEYYNPAIAAVNRMQGYPARQTLENISENNLKPKLLINCGFKGIGVIPPDISLTVE